MKARRSALVLCSSLLAMLALGACERNKTPAEKMGDKIENAGDKVEDKLD